MATDAGKLSEPRDVRHYYYANPATGALTPLETRDARRWDTKEFFVVSLHGYANGGFEFSGAHSAFRIKSGQPQEFVIRFSGNYAVDRNALTDGVKTYVWLSRVASKKNKRRLELARWPLYGSEAWIGKDRVLCDVLPYGEESYLISPNEPLPPGEYAFLGPAECAHATDRCSDCQAMPGHGTVFTFGIDP